MKRESSSIENSIYRLFEITPTPTILSFPNGRLEYVNPAAKKLFGYEKEEIYGTDVIITHPDDVLANKKLRKKLTDDPFSPVTIKKRYLHKSGYTIDALLVIVAQPDESVVVKRYIAQITDLSPIKKADAGELLLSHLVNESCDAIYVIDPNSGAILNSNNLGFQRLGYSKEELLTMSLTDFNPNYDTKNKWIQYIQLAQTKVRHIIESTHRKKDGTLIPIEASLSYTKHGGQEYLLAVVRDITQRKIKESEILITSNLDPLTQLPNRRILDVKLDEIFNKAKENDTYIAFIYIDLDKFKMINDSYGHTVGDAILQGAAGRLKRSVRKSDVITRLGGDEFLLVIPGFKDFSDIGILGQKIVYDFKSPFKIKTTMLHVSASIGVAVYREDKANGNTDAKMLIERADSAMYEAKKYGGTHIVYYQNDLILENATTRKTN